jgi:hypothetical protein
VRSPKDALRFWWIRNGERFGLALVVLALAGLLVLFRPAGHPIPLTGVVTAINVQDARRNPPFNAWVDLSGSQTVVGLPAQHRCVVGSRIALQKSRFMFVEHYAISGNGCDVPPAPGR